jgi:hypothetical protein
MLNTPPLMLVKAACDSIIDHVTVCEGLPPPVTAALKAVLPPLGTLAADGLIVTAVTVGEAPEIVTAAREDLPGSAVDAALTVRAARVSAGSMFSTPPLIFVKASCDSRIDHVTV